jgi:hypothetical protein
MPISSHGVCRTEIKDVFTVAKAVESALRTLVELRKCKDVIFDKDNQFPQIDISPSCEMLVFHFTLRGDRRSLYLHFGCDRDYAEEIPGKKIIWSVNQWGAHAEIILSVGKALAQLGPIYTRMNDCDDSRFERAAATI